MMLDPGSGRILERSFFFFSRIVDGNRRYRVENGIIEDKMCKIARLSALSELEKLIN